MENNYIALVVSVISAVIASVSLGWNIYRDVIFRARARMTLAVVSIIHESLPDRPRYVSLDITNLGPGPMTVSSISAKRHPLWKRLLRRRAEWAYVMEDYQNILSTRLPKKLEVGERANVLLPYDKECLLGAGFTHVGLTDTFGRHHWASSAALASAHKAYEKDFGSAAKAADRS